SRRSCARRCRRPTARRCTAASAPSPAAPSPRSSPHPLASAALTSPRKYALSREKPAFPQQSAYFRGGSAGGAHGRAGGGEVDEGLRARHGVDSGHEILEHGDPAARRESVESGCAHAVVGG